MKLEAARRLTASLWWDALTDEQKKEYVEEHPESKYAQDHPTAPTEPKPKGPVTDPDKPKTVNAPSKPKAPPPLKAPGPLKEPPALEEGPEAEEEPKEEEEPSKPSKPTKPKKKEWDEDAERSLLKYLYHKGGRAAKKKAKELVKEGLKKGGSEALRRLIDPMALTDIGKKGKLPELPFKFKSKEGKIKDLQGKLSKLNKRKKGYGKNVPQSLTDEISVLNEKLEKLQGE